MRPKKKRRTKYVSTYSDIDQRVMMAAMDHVSSFDSADAITSGATTALVNAYDHQIDRDPFISLAMDGCRLQNYLGRLHTFAFVLQLLSDNKLTPNLLAEILTDCTRKCEEVRERFIDQCEDVIQCPSANDPIN